MADDLKRLEEALQRILTKRRDLRLRIANMAVARIGARSIQDYMQDGPKKRAYPSNAPLIMQSQKLARAVKGGPGSRKKIKVVDAVTKFIFTILLPYAAIHEHGGSIVITSQMRSFFWAMWFETGEEKWKFMAITPKNRLIIEARPYLEPAMDDELPEIQKRALQIMLAFLDAELSK